MDAARINLHPRFVVDSSGEASEVVLSLQEFRELMELLEDYIDARDLDEAIKTAKGFTPLGDVIAELKRDGLL